MSLDKHEEFAKIHGLFELPQGNSAVQKIVGESKISPDYTSKGVHKRITGIQCIVWPVEYE